MSGLARLGRWALLWALVGVGLGGLVLLGGEVAPGAVVSVWAFVGIKVAGGVIVWLCVLAGKFFNRRGMLPDFDDPVDEAGWDD